MQLIGLIFIGVVAAAATLLAVTTSDNNVAIVSGLIGALTFLLFAFFALDVTVFDDSGTAQTVRYPALAVWGLMMAAPNAYVALTGPLELIAEKNPTKNQMQ
jgi:hypothetical protein